MACSVSNAFLPVDCTATQLIAEPRDAMDSRASSRLMSSHGRELLIFPVRRVNRHEHRSSDWKARNGRASRSRFSPYPPVSARLLLALRDVGHSQRVAHGSVASRHHGATLPLRGGQLVGGRRCSPPWPRCSPLVTAMVFLGRRAPGARICDLESRLTRVRVSGLARRAWVSVGNRLHECRGPSLSFDCSGALTRNWRTQQCSGLVKNPAVWSA